MLLLVAWTIATGAHWDFVQVAAWGRMWARYVQVQPWTVALDTTFSPGAMCGMCKTVQAAKQQQGDQPLAGVPALEKPPLLLPMLRAVTVEPPRLLGQSGSRDVLCPRSMRDAPPVPPPRPDAIVG